MQKSDSNFLSINKTLTVDAKIFFNQDGLNLKNNIKI